MHATDALPATAKAKRKAQPSRGCHVLIAASFALLMCIVLWCISGVAVDTVKRVEYNLPAYHSLRSVTLAALLAAIVENVDKTEGSSAFA